MEDKISPSVILPHFMLNVFGKAHLHALKEVFSQRADSFPQSVAGNTFHVCFGLTCHWAFLPLSAAAASADEWAGLPHQDVAI